MIEIHFGKKNDIYINGIPRLLLTTKDTIQWLRNNDVDEVIFQYKVHPSFPKDKKTYENRINKITKELGFLRGETKNMVIRGNVFENIFRTYAVLE